MIKDSVTLHIEADEQGRVWWVVLAGENEEKFAEGEVSNIFDADDKVEWVRQLGMAFEDYTSWLRESIEDSIQL